MHILVSGGTGFIGSHTVVELLNTGCEVTVFDNLSNSKASVIGRIEKLTGKRPAFFKCDMNDRRGMNKVFSSAHFDAVIHFAGYKAVGESVEKPLMYYENNICGTLVLLDMMKKYGVENLIFSSSATVYGIPEKCPVTESSPLSTFIRLM